MTLYYEDGAPIHTGAATEQWHHEGVGGIEPTADGRGMDLACLGSRQGLRGCMAFLKSPLPDHVAISYELTVHSQRGLVINYMGMRGLDGQDPFDPESGLPAREGVMANYWAPEFGLRSYHISFSRYNDKGEHTRTANIRRNPGGYLVGHGTDPVRQTGRAYKVRLTKDRGAIQLFIDGELAISSVDHATSLGPIPGEGYFGFRLVGDDVRATVKDFMVCPITPAKVWDPWVYKG